MGGIIGAFFGFFIGSTILGFILTPFLGGLIGAFLGSSAGRNIEYTLRGGARQNRKNSRNFYNEFYEQFFRDAQNSQYKNRYNSGQSYNNHGYPGQNSNIPTVDYYKILGCTGNDSDNEIKRQYRKMVSEFHPDRVAGKDLSPEFVKLAEDKFREVQDAYEKIRKERGF